ncbi:MAG TPA: MFS transporter [Victivallales bacterium]|nr:MFS transporter [Victivallales bacterium]
MIKILTPFKNDEFKWLFISQIAFYFSKNLDNIATSALLVYSWNLGPFYLAVIAIAYSLPMLFSLLSGALVDKWPLRRVIIYTTFATTLITLSFSYVTDLRIFIILIVIRSINKTFFRPASSAIIKNMFQKDELLAVTSSIQGLIQIFGVSVPIIGGMLLGFLTPQDVFFITSSIYFISGIFLFLLPKRFDTTHINNIDKGRKPLTLVKDIRNTCVTFFSNHKLFMGLITLFLGIFSYFLSNSLITLFAKEVGFTKSTFVIIFIVLGGGGVIGAITVSEFKKKQKIILILVGLLIIGVSYIACVINSVLYAFTNKYFFLSCWFFVGFGGSFVYASFDALVIEEVSKKSVAKSVAFISVVTGICLLFAPTLGAYIAEAISVKAPFLLTGIIMTAGSLIMLLIIFITHHPKRLKQKLK